MFRLNESEPGQSTSCGWSRTLSSSRWI
jgi:hypothetical protein